MSSGVAAACGGCQINILVHMKEARMDGWWWGDVRIGSEGAT